MDCYRVGVERYMYSYRTITVRTSRFGAWGLTTNTGNSPSIQKGAPAAMQHCLITTSRRTAKCHELRTWKQSPLDSDHVLILNASLTRVCLTCPEKWSCGLFDRPLVAGCSTGHKPRPLHVNEWDLSQSKKINYTSNTIFWNMVLVI